MRYAVVRWGRSVARAQADRRKTLLDLDQAAVALRDGGDRDRALDLLLKTQSTLMRAWVDE
ncbi:MAG: hypothetical protein RIB45_14275 [Marivibrio sp.]|uniref:hypothetical protein n=1 Tax=Marivibrio sp. TaxID=2039719 RepID=UPI0032F04B3B